MELTKEIEEKKENGRKVDMKLIYQVKKIERVRDKIEVKLIPNSDLKIVDKEEDEIFPMKQMETMMKGLMKDANPFMDMVKPKDPREFSLYLKPDEFNSLDLKIDSKIELTIGKI